MKLSKAPREVLLALASGYRLQSHRHLDGSKLLQLHPHDGQPAQVDRTAVADLKDRGLIESNQKFPAATYSLTAKGKEVAALLEGPGR
jgi:hypothetical protein